MKGVCYTLLIVLFTLSGYTQTNEDFESHYLFPVFEKGSILMNNGQKYETLLNYNTLTREMVMENDGVKMAIAETDVGLIDTVYIKNKKLFLWKGVFVELLHKSDYEIFMERRCKLKELGKPIGYGARSRTTAITNYTSFSGWDRAYDLKLPDVYQIDPEIIYWINRNGESESFSSLWELKKVYREKKALIKAYIKENDFNYEDQESMIQLIGYLELN